LRVEESTMRCSDCGEDIDDEPIRMKVRGKNLKLCEDCGEIRQEQQEIGEAAEGAVQDMMGYKGKW
jgi:ribosome-binding protein aMBF1 (putative translation factor)